MNLEIEWVIISIGLLVVLACGVAAIWVLRRSVASGSGWGGHDDQRVLRRIRSSFFCLALGFAVFTLYGSFIPFVGMSEFNDAARLSNTFRWSFSRTDMAANFLLAFPTAYFAMGFANPKTGSRFILAGITVLLVCSALSVASECGQLWIPNRVPSWTDILMQHIGALTGIVAWKFSGRTVTDWFGQLVSYERSDRRWNLLLELYVVGLIAYHLLPLDLTLNVGEIGKKYLDGKITIIPFQNFNGASIDWLYLVRDIAIYIPMGAFVTTWMREGSAPRSFAKTICLGFVSACALEATQIVIRSRFADMGDVVIGMIGIAIGYGMTLALKRMPFQVGEGAGGWGALVIGMLCLLPCIFWFPYGMTYDKQEIMASFKQFFAIPFSRLFLGNRPLGFVVICLRDVLCFVPLGLLWSQIVALKNTSRRRGWAWTICGLLGLALYALALELGQTVIMTRVSDITGSLLFFAGGCLGFWVAWQISGTRDSHLHR